MKIIYKNAINRFVPMTEEQQKDFMFLLLDTMDEIAEKIDNAEDKKLKETYYRDFKQYEAMASFFIDDPEWMKKTPYSSIGYLRKYANDCRRKWENKIHKA